MFHYNWTNIEDTYLIYHNVIITKKVRFLVVLANEDSVSHIHGLVSSFRIVS